MIEIINDGIDAVSEIICVEIDYITHFTIRKTEIGKKLFLKKLSVFHNGFELKDESIIDNEIKTKIWAYQFSFIIDGYLHLILYFKAIHS